jgi:hypothetical protein
MARTATAIRLRFAQRFDRKRTISKMTHDPICAGMMTNGMNATKTSG